MAQALLLCLAAFLIGSVRASSPVVVAWNPAVPTYDGSVLKSVALNGGCINPNWNSTNPLTCLNPRLNGVIYDGPQHPSWDPTGVWSKWVNKTDRTISPIVGIHVGHVPGTDAYLFNGRSSKLSFDANGDVVSGVYDMGTNTFRNVSTDTSPFCAGLSLMADGRILVAGGTTPEQPGGPPDGRKSVRYYNYTKNSTNLPDAVLMRYNRWYPTVTLLADNNIFVMGGTQTASETSTPNNYFERWDAREGTYNSPMQRTLIEKTFLPQMGKQFYPSMFVLPTSEVFILQDQYSRIIKPAGNPTYRFVTAANGSSIPLSAPLYPFDYKTQFPHIGMAAMLPLTWEDNYGSAEIVMFGGSPFPSTNNVSLWCATTNNTAKTTPANRFSYRLKISWTLNAANDWVYTFGNWVKESMGIPRVGGDSVLLPNGDIVLTGGAQTGCSCGIRTGVNRGNYPALWPLLYQPDRPEGQRYTVMSATSIARMYHGTAVLTTNGTLLVSGCDACEQKTIVSTANFWSGSPSERWEFRTEEFYPPYALDYKAKPKITGINGLSSSGIINLLYGATFTLTWVPLDATQTDVTTISKVSLVAPSSVTHGFNSNQRVVFLKIVSRIGNTLTLQIPAYASPTLGVLPPQIYKIFIMNGKTYSTAWWVKLTKPGAPVGRRLGEVQPWESDQEFGTSVVSDHHRMRRKMRRSRRTV